LHQQLPADPRPRLVEYLGCQRQVPLTDQADQAIAKIPALEQHEDDHGQHHSGGAQRPYERAQPGEPGKPRDLIGAHDDRLANGPRGRPLRWFALIEAGLDLVQRFLQLLDRAALAGAAHVRDLRPDIAAIARQVVRQVTELARQSPAGEAEHREHQGDDGQNGGDAPDPAFEPGHRRRQDECQQDGQRDRNEDDLSQVQHDDDEHAAGERHPRFQGLYGIIHHGADPQPHSRCQPIVVVT
jgi:hypothetical protein